MIFIIGSNGQLGREMQRILTNEGADYTACDYPDIDITQLDSLIRWMDEVDPSTVINCAAYTNVDQAETDEDAAFRVNALGPENLAKLCDERHIELVHISTDYVFSGDGIKQNGRLRPYCESDECHPDTAYGRTKLAGEEFVRKNHKKSYILRTAWLYGDGNNFVKTMLNFAENRNEINVVNDQFGSPTSTVDLANAIVELMGSAEYGTYHATCEGVCTWYDFAKNIFKIKNKSVKVIPVTSAEFIRPAKRPAWSVLENARLKKQGKNVFRQWEESLEEYLFNLKEK